MTTKTNKKKTKAPGKKSAGSTRGKSAKAKTMQTVAKKKLYTCSTCGRVTTEKGHLCFPVMATRSYSCDYCGMMSTNSRHICKPMANKIKFFCDTCGRVAGEKVSLCRPKEIR